MVKRSVSFFVDDLSTNAIVRAAPLAKALRESGFDVEVLGLLLTGPEIYAPYRDEFEYKTVRASKFSFDAALRLARQSSGNIVFGCKPLITSLLPALLASEFGRGRLLLLDVEDDELWMGSLGNGQISPLPAKLRRIWGLRATLVMHAFCGAASGVSVVSSALKRRYGGRIVLHGPDERRFDPDRVELTKAECRRKFRLPPTAELVLFAGIAHPHKGLDVLVAALADRRLRAVELVLAGDATQQAFKMAASKLSGRVHVVGSVPNPDMPHLLAAVDIVPTPQLRNRFTECQIPAKLLEAMAMRKAVVVSAVSDLPCIVGSGTAVPRGWSHPPGDSAALANCLFEIISDPTHRHIRGANARQYFMENASANAISCRLNNIILEASGTVV